MITRIFNSPISLKAYRFHLLAVCAFTYFVTFTNNSYSQGTRYWYTQYDIVMTGNTIELASGGYASVGTAKIPSASTMGYDYAIFVVKFDASHNYLWSKVYQQTNNLITGTHISEDLNGDFLISSRWWTSPYRPFLLKVSSTGNVLWNILLNELEGVKTVVSPEVDEDNLPYGDIYYLHGAHSSTLYHAPALSRVDNAGTLKSVLVFNYNIEALPVDFVFNYVNQSSLLSAFYVLSKTHTSGLSGERSPVINRIWMNTLPQSVSIPTSFLTNSSNNEWGKKLNLLPEWEDFNPIAILHKPSDEDGDGSVYVLANVSPHRNASQVRVAVIKMGAANGAIIDAYFYDFSNPSGPPNNILDLIATSFNFVPNTDRIAITLRHRINNVLLETYVAVIDNNLSPISLNLHNLNYGEYYSVLEDNAAGKITTNGFKGTDFILATSNTNGETQCNEPMSIIEEQIFVSSETEENLDLLVEPQTEINLIDYKTNWDLTWDCGTLKKEYLSISEKPNLNYTKTYIKNRTIFVESPNNYQKVQLISLDGKVTGIFSGSKGKYQFDGNNLPDGIYLIKYIDNESVSTTKIMLSK